MSEELEEQQSIYASHTEWFALLTAAVAGMAKMVDDPPPYDSDMVLKTLVRAKAMVTRITKELGHEKAIAAIEQMEQP